jgi:hypothetical protein
MAVAEQSGELQELDEDLVILESGNLLAHACDGFIKLGLRDLGKRALVFLADGAGENIEIPLPGADTGSVAGRLIGANRQ